LAADLFSVETVLRRDALRSGYTLVNPTQTAWLGLPADSVSGAKKLRVKLSKVAHPEKYYGTSQPISDLYRYSFQSQDTFKLKQPVALQLSYPASYGGQTIVVKYYDSVVNRWRPVGKQSNVNNLLVQRGRLLKKHAIIALFEKNASGEVVEGLASWYDWTGAACNSFPMGSRIRTTNVATGAYVDSTIVSTGPFIPGRVVDLTRDDFSKIADLSAGVATVTVQLVP
jgi:hypothetical protein